MFQKLGHLNFEFVSDFDIRISDFWTTCLVPTMLGQEIENEGREAMGWTI